MRLTHVLFLTDNFPPEVNAPASRTYEHCRHWVQAGHKVTVITGAPNFPKGKVYEGYRNRWRSRETIDGIEVIRVWTYITANEGFLKRTLDYSSFMLSAIPAAIGIKNVDIIVGTSPQLFTPCAAWIASLFQRCPYVFELRDLWPESIRAVGAVKHMRILDALEAVELFLYRKAAHIISVTHAFKDNLVARGIEGEKVSVVTNGVDLYRFRPAPRNEKLACKLGLNDKFVAGYVGTHGMAHGLDALLDAAKILGGDPAAQNVRFLFIGDGAEKASLIERARSLQLNNVIFLDTVCREEVADYWSLLDVSIIHLKKTPLFETVIPSKLFECMAMGTPVVHGVAGESADIVEREGNGIVVESDKAKSLSDSIRRLMSDPSLRARLAENGLIAARNYDRTVLAGRMLSILEAIQKPRAIGVQRRSKSKSAL